jgi:cell fate (sporulation/competence/biofilm development) regulator YlbF (YheA/YmcA/DUF963 family)
MKKVEEAVEELISAVEQQECYLKYQQYLAELKEDRELFSSFNEFRKRNLEHHMEQQGLREQTEFRREYEALLSKEPVRQFLHWEQETTRMYRKIYDTILEKSKLDTSFLD